MIKRYHYTYRITNIIENKHYYGSRTTSKYKETLPKDDLGIRYFSSSANKWFIKDQRENPQNYKYKILKIFKTRKEAIKLEIKLHNMFNVSINESFYNKSKQTSTKFDTTGCSSWNKGVTPSKESIQKQKITKSNPEWIKNVDIPAREKAKNTYKKTFNSPEFQKRWSDIRKRAGISTSKTMSTTQYKKDKAKIYEENGKKISKTVSTKEWKETTGKIRSEKLSKIRSSKEYQEKYKESYKIGRIKEQKTKNIKQENGYTITEIINLKNTKFFRIINNKNEVIEEHVSKKYICKKYNSVLLHASITSKLGCSIQRKRWLNKQKCLHMIGWYIEEVKKKYKELF